MIRLFILLAIAGALLCGCAPREVQGSVTPEAKRTEETQKAVGATQGTPESVTANP